MLKLKNLKLNVVEKLKIFAPISLAIILIGIILMIIPGMNVGLDFGGGAKVNVDFTSYLTIHEDAKSGLADKVKEVITQEGFEIATGSERWLGENATELELGLKYVLDGKQVNATDDATQEAFRSKIEEEGGLLDKIVAAINEYNAEVDLTKDNAKTQIVSGYTAQKLLENAIVATIIAVIIMLIYIGFRFTFSSGIAAVIALCHDVLIMLALTTIFRVQVNTTFIAAIITIVGYSINATIVIFDKIRAISKQSSMANATDTEIANKAIVSTLGRSIITTVTTLATIVVLAVVCSIMGVTSIEEFALPIVFGLLAGAYSSVLLSAPIWVMLRKLGAKIKNRA